VFTSDLTRFSPSLRIFFVEPSLLSDSPFNPPDFPPSPPQRSYPVNVVLDPESFRHRIVFTPLSNPETVICRRLFSPFFNLPLSLPF